MSSIKDTFPYTISSTAILYSGDLSEALASGKIPVVGVNHVNISGSATIQSNTGVTVSSGNYIDVSRYDYLIISNVGVSTTPGGVSSTSITVSYVD